MWNYSDSGKTSAAKTIFYMFGAFHSFMHYHPEKSVIEGLDFNKVDTVE